jgi:catechol 2,3-dioxygenase-like lactoylglutathione lyase family enzyme
MNLIRIDHVSLNAADRAATLDWYADVLGLRAAHPDAPPDHPVFLGNDGAQLGVFDDAAPGLRHVALATDHVSQERIVARLDALALPYRVEEHRASHSVYFADPDGATLEVLVPR